MIVKIKNSQDSYNFFEADSIMQVRHNMKLIDLQGIYNQDTLFIINDYVNIPDLGYLGLNLYKKHKVVQWVITDNRCYLMNDEGKTIEKLN